MSDPDNIVNERYAAPKLYLMLHVGEAIPEILDESGEVRCVFDLPDGRKVVKNWMPTPDQLAEMNLLVAQGRAEFALGSQIQAIIDQGQEDKEPSQ